MLRLGAVGVLLQDELHHQEAGAAVLVVLVVVIGASHGTVAPDVAGHADVLVQTGVAGLGEGGAVDLERAERIRLEERMLGPGGLVLPGEVLRERLAVGPRELVHPGQGGAAAVGALHLEVLVVVAGAVGLADGDDALGAAALEVTLAVRQAVSARGDEARHGIRLRFTKRIVAVGELLAHELVRGGLGGLPAGGVVVAVAGVLVGLRVPLGVGVEGRRGGEAQDPELEAQGAGARHAAVLRGAHGPGKVRSGLVAELHDEVHGLREGVARIMHLLGGIHGVVQDGHAAQFE